MNSYVKFIGKRIIYSILTIIAISMFAFLIVHLLPGDPIRAMLGIEADQAEVDRVKEELHMFEPLPVQYVLWVNDILHGRFGESIMLGQDIGELIQQRLPVTLWLSVPAMMISIILGITIGIVCATHRGSFADQALTVLMTTLNGIPVFWIGLLLIYLFGVKLQVLPFVGFVLPKDGFKQFILHGILPWMIMSFRPVSSIARQVRTNMLDVINQEYIRTARAYGISERKVKFKYALKNVLIPVITLIALQVRAIVGGSLIAERVFSIAGISRAVTTAVQNNDFLVIQMLVLVISFFVVMANMLLDIAYGIVDPRIRINGGK